MLVDAVGNQGHAADESEWHRCPTELLTTVWFSAFHFLLSTTQYYLQDPFNFVVTSVFVTPIAASGFTYLAPFHPGTRREVIVCTGRGGEERENEKEEKKESRGGEGGKRRRRRRLT